MIRSALRIGLVIWLAATLPAWFLGRDVALGVLLGGAIGLVNLWGLARILGAAAGARGARAALLGFLLVTKFLLLAAAVIVCLRYAHVEPLAFMVGISIFVLALFASGARRNLGAAS